MKLLFMIEQTQNGDNEETLKSFDFKYIKNEANINVWNIKPPINAFCPDIIALKQLYAAPQ